MLFLKTDQTILGVIAMNVKKKRRVLLLLGLGFFLIVGGITCYLVINYQDDQHATKVRMEQVSNLYDTFKEDVTAFNEAKKKIYQNVMKDMYYQTLKENDQQFKSLFASYLKSLEKLDKDYDKLKNKCINVLYPEVNINHKCEAFLLAYEEAVNTYLSDVEAYNNNIKAYNNWLKETNSAEPLLTMISLHREYLDVDGDRKYRGKAESDVGDLTDEEAKK